MYFKPARYVLIELAGNSHIRLLCQGALHLITSSTYGLFSSSGLAQSPTPTDTFEFGNASFNARNKGVATSTSPRSLFLKIKILL